MFEGMFALMLALGSMFAMEIVGNIREDYLILRLIKLVVFLTFATTFGIGILRFFYFAGYRLVIL